MGNRRDGVRVMAEAMAEWRERGACVGSTVTFFGDDSKPGKPEAEWERRAKAVCATCPVRRECSAYEDAHPTRWGVVAAETAKERVKRRSVGKGSRGSKRPGYTRKVA
jgi:WhiB family redox-sensing transcriptional regulator